MPGDSRRTAEAGHAARDAIDRALAARPRRDGAALTSAVQNLSAFRDLCIARQRQEAGSRARAALDRVNAVISIVLAAQFPLGDVPWEELGQARAWLQGVLGDAAPSRDLDHDVNRPIPPA